LLLVLFMQPMAAAAATIFLKLKPVWRVLFIFCRHVVALFALGALQNYVISRHIFLSGRWSVAGDQRIFSDHWPLATDNCLFTPLLR
jgi:hypothetical protein